jgi:hypothetical protein
MSGSKDIVGRRNSDGTVWRGIDPSEEARLRHDVYDQERGGFITAQNVIDLLDNITLLRGEIARLSEQVEKQGKVVEAVQKMTPNRIAAIFHRILVEGDESADDELAAWFVSVKDALAALNGSSGLHAPEARDGVADERTPHLRDRNAAE